MVVVKGLNACEVFLVFSLGSGSNPDCNSFFEALSAVPLLLTKGKTYAQITWKQKIKDDMVRI